MRSLFLGFFLSVGLTLSPAEEDDWGAAPPGAFEPAPAVPSAAGAASARAKPGPPPASVRRAQLLKVRANGLYRARRYRQACDLYADCARLDLRDADARNDMAACYRKLGLKDSALACAREALRLADAGLASADTAAWSFPDLRARKNAYFLLDQLGSPMPAPKPGQCETWTASEGECRDRIRVCAERGSRPAAGKTSRWDILRVSAFPLKALFAYEEVEASESVPRPQTRDMESASIDGVPEAFSLWLNRDSAVTIPLGESLENADPACSGTACGGLEKELSECRILHFDACAGVIGLACAYQEDGGSDRIVIGEGYFLPGVRRDSARPAIP